MIKRLQKVYFLMSLSEYISGRITLDMQSDLRLTFVSPKSQTTYMHSKLLRVKRALSAY